MAESFLSYLHSHDHTSKTPPETLVALLLEFGIHAVRFEQVSRGYANEVHRCFTTTGNDVYLRIQRRGRIPFSSEAWAMEQCRVAGLPVPRVLGLTTLDDAQGSRDVMILEIAPGRPLADVMNALDMESMATVSGRIGAMLRSMHDITVEQFGPIGVGSTRSWAAYARETLRARRADASAAIGAGLGSDEVDALLRIIKGLNEVECNTPSLCHGDISADHVFIAGSLELTWIIDFGMCQGGSGMLDIAVFTMFHPEVQPEWLWHGYMPGKDMPVAYRRQILSFQADIAMSYLAHDVRLGNADSRGVVLAGLRSILAARHSLE